MDEKSLKSRIKKLSIAVVIISFAILIAVVAASYNLRDNPSGCTLQSDGE